MLYTVCPIPRFDLFDHTYHYGVLRSRSLLTLLFPGRALLEPFQLISGSPVPAGTRDTVVVPF